MAACIVGACVTVLVIRWTNLSGPIIMIQDPPEYCANSFRSIQQTRMNIKWCCLDHMYFIRPKTSVVNLYRNVTYFETEVTYFGTEEYLLQFKRLLLSHLEMHKGGTNIHLADSVEFLEVMHKDRRYKLPRTNKTDIRC